MGKILDKINNPQDIKGLSLDELKELCAELREYIVECCAENPGHLASSLGSVELIVGMHYIYDAPVDKLVFDVGHQAYAHKILTGRKDSFKTNRTKDGISGFPKRSESEYDSFGVGHSSTSISAALGFAEAARIRGTKEKIVALIGDGALTGGLAFEGMNNAGNSKANLLVILNDNNQSIDSNLGGLHNHLLKITTNTTYNNLKEKVWTTLGETRTRNFFQRWLRSFKAWVVKKTGGDLFESLGFRYFGPIDGNDIEQVITALGKIKELRGPRVLHCLTIKGKGYKPAELDPTVWHAPGKFDVTTGERIKVFRKADRYQDVFGQTLIDLAKRDRRVIGITPAMASGCGMTDFAHAFPDRFFDVGIEEEHSVTFSAGLAAGGMKPFCNIYSSFAQRAYDQIIHDVALQNLPVTLCFDRAGLVGEDGATHNGAFDLSAFRVIPNLTIIVPKDEMELRNAMFTALEMDSPVIIRYPRGMGEGVEWKDKEAEVLPHGRGECIQEGNGDIAILALGPVVNRAVEASAKLNGTKPYIYNMRYMKPVDESILDAVARKCRTVITLEDGSICGGLFGAVSEYMASKEHPVHVEGVGIPDRFISQASQKQQQKECGLDVENILNKLRKFE